MRAFSQLALALSATADGVIQEKQIEEYLRQVSGADAAWAVHLLLGRWRTRRISRAVLETWAGEVMKVPGWLMEECHAAVGDWAEAIALLVEPLSRANGAASGPALACFVELGIVPLASQPESIQRERVHEAWQRLDKDERWLFHRLVSGSFRPGVPPAAVARSLARTLGAEPALMARQLDADWIPSAAAFERWRLLRELPDLELPPYPFHLASTLDESPAAWPPFDSMWAFEWHWLGIRCQLIRRRSGTLLWNRHAELVTRSFPEIIAAAELLPLGTVLDGVLLAWAKESPLPASILQKRLGARPTLARARSESPTIFMAFDLLESDGLDRRSEPWHARRVRLETTLREAQPEAFRPSAASPRQFDLFASAGEAPAATPSPTKPAESRSLRLSPLLEVRDLAELGAVLAGARAKGVAGIIGKRRDAIYGGARDATWGKWKLRPLEFDAALVGAGPASGLAPGNLSEFTFAIRDGKQWVPVAKLVSTLPESEQAELMEWIRAYSTGRFGPIHALPPERIFRLAFARAEESSRHKARIQLHEVRIRCWRRDGLPGDVASVQSVRAQGGILAADGLIGGGERVGESLRSRGTGPEEA